MKFEEINERLRELDRLKMDAYASGFERGEAKVKLEINEIIKKRHDSVDEVKSELHYLIDDYIKNLKERS